MKYPIHEISLSEAQKAFPDLAHIYRVPNRLYIRGAPLERFETRTAKPLKKICIVGTRKPSSYGRSAVKDLITQLAGYSVCIVSGLAYGIDSLAHEAALEAKIPTIAVPGSGLDDDSIYPRAHTALAQKILETDGLLLSEYPPGTSARNYFFPERNRIMAAIADLIIVIEAQERSGTLITTRFGLDLGKDVCAVPGPIDSVLSSGTNLLIQQGAYPILSAKDILDVLHLPEKTQLSIGQNDAQNPLFKDLHTILDSLEE